MQQLNFLEPACFADLEQQRNEQEEQARAVLKSAPVAVVVKAPDVEVGPKISELEVLYQKLKNIDAYLEHKSIVNDMWRSVRELKAEHNVKFEEASQLFDECGGAPVALMDELEELRNKITAKTFDSVDYEKENNLFRPPADLDKRDLYQEQISALETELAGMQAVVNKSPCFVNKTPVFSCCEGVKDEIGIKEPVLTPSEEPKTATDQPLKPEIKPGPWQEWSGKTLQCPNCTGALVPTGPDSWVCNQDKKHHAWPHYDMLAVRSSEGARYWVPGMFGRGVIPDPETVVLEEPAAAESYLTEPVCAFCPGDLVQIAPRGWECSGNSMHAFWIQQGCGVWKEQHGRSILKKAPSWATQETEMMSQ